ncbi:MAG: choice-of-anchor Q domain-containing protein [Bacteroidia bacterium]
MQRNIFLLSLAILFLNAFSYAQYTAGQTYFGTNNYIEYQAGSLPIIISAPHGGDMYPATIPDRSCTGCVTGNDTRTMEVVRELADALEVMFGQRPHIIINRLARIKLDANRAIGDAALGNMDAETAWAEYHTFIQAAKDSNRAQYGTALYIDMHGHGHPKQRIEYGYLMGGALLRNSDAFLNANNSQNGCSIRHLKNVLNPSVDFSEILRGSECMGELIAEFGYPGTPSASDTAPLVGDPFFNGGYNTVRHGSRDSSVTNGVQFELYYTGIRNNTTNRAKFARAAACAIRDYLDRWFFDLDSWSPGHVVSSTADRGPGSLREALLGAEDGDVITFSPTLNGDTIRLTDELRVCSKVTIQGPGASLLAISGGDSTRLMRILKTDSASIKGLSLVRGRAVEGGDGGGILVEGILHMNNCTLAYNHAEDDGGGMRIEPDATAYIDSCIIAGNTCDDDGAGISLSTGILVLTNSTVRDNAATSSAGGLLTFGDARIIRSTCMNNTANNFTGGIHCGGGQLSMENSTITGNSSTNRTGGLHVTGGAMANLNFCTIVNNTAATNRGGGIAVLTSSSCTLVNTLVASNTSPTEPDVYISISSTVVSGGSNFIGDSTGSGWAPAPGDQLGNTAAPINPLILPITNNGGPTFTVALNGGSPCVDMGSNAMAPATDQRGRSRIYGTQADIGAFEFQPPLSVEQGSGELSFGDDKKADFTLFPNPATDRIEVQFLEKGSYHITIGNTLGQMVLETFWAHALSGSVDVSALPAGTYWIKVNGNITSERMFVVRK